MKTIEEIVDNLFENCSGDMSKNDAKRIAKDCIGFAQRWLLLNSPKEEGVDYIFKRKDGRCSIGHFEFIGSKLCIVSDIGYSMVEDSEFKYFRAINII